MIKQYYLFFFKVGYIFTINHNIGDDNNDDDNVADDNITIII